MTTVKYNGHDNGPRKMFFNRGVSAPGKPLPGMTRRVLVLGYFAPTGVFPLAYTEESSLTCWLFFISPLSFLLLISKHPLLA